MRARRRNPRPRPRSLRSGAFFFVMVGLAGLGAPAPTPAQEQDTARVREQPDQALPPDTVRQDTVDSIPPPPTPLPSMRPVGATGWAQGVWEWNREDLLRLPNLSLLDLLEQIPGVVPIRSDIAGQPQAGAVFGATAGAVEYVMDGFALDPLTSPTFDPAAIGLLALERVRVERRVTGATVRIETVTPDDGRVKSVIEAGTGDYSVNMFRGMFLPPRVFGGALGLGYERLASDGFIAAGSANNNVSWVKWTWAREATGIQFSYRSSNMDRRGVGEGVVSRRSDWAVRARGALGPFTGEAYSGASSVEDELAGEEGTVLQEGTPQAGLRLGASLDAPVPLDARVAFRYRDHPRLPAQALELDVDTRPLPWLSLGGSAVQEWWPRLADTGRYGARAVVGPFLGVEAFAEVVRGGAPNGPGAELNLAAAVDSASFQVTREGSRAGARLEWGRLALGAAVLNLSTDTVVPFGLSMETGVAGVGRREARGFEAMARLPTGLDPFTIEGWYVGIDAPAGWLYLPRHQWRAALVYHHLPLPSGNLELYARLEHVYRGWMSVPAAPAQPGDPLLQAVPEYRATGLELVIRVLSVRAFIRWNNLLHRLGQEDLPGYTKPGQHLLWGVKWEFWN